MNAQEAASLVGYLNRAGLLQALEGQAAVWCDLLDDVDFVDARAAARDLAMVRSGADRWLTPGDIRVGVRRIRADRLARTPDPLPDADPSDPAAYIAALRAGRTMVADPTTRPRPIGALIAGMADRMHP